MRKVLVSVAAAVAVAVPLVLTGTASAGTSKPAAASYCCTDAGTYYTSMTGYDHWFHVNHVNYMARRSRGLY